MACLNIIYGYGTMSAQQDYDDAVKGLLKSGKIHLWQKLMIDEGKAIIKDGKLFFPNEGMD